MSFYSPVVIIRKVVTIKSCPNCGSLRIPQHRVLIGGVVNAEMMPGIEVKAVLVTRYCRCQNCYLIFQNPRLSDKELDIYYSSGYYRKTITQPPEGMAQAELNRARIAAGIVSKHLREVRSHLDIGCGLGYLLREINADIRVGVESDIQYVSVKGIKVYRKLSQVSPKKFDLVTSIHTLEHVPHPLNYLKTMKRFVSKNGHLIIEVPSWKTRGGPLGFAHLYHFEPDVLKLMCARIGLKVVDVEFTPHLVLICRLADI